MKERQKLSQSQKKRKKKKSKSSDSQRQSKKKRKKLKKFGTGDAARSPKQCLIKWLTTHPGSLFHTLEYTDSCYAVICGDAQFLMNYALHHAAQDGHACITKQLIEARCNIDLPDEEGTCCSTSQPNKGMRQSQNSSLKLAAALIFRRRLVTQHSTAQSQMVMRPSRNS
jgi:hypothetical protein